MRTIKRFVIVGTDESGAGRSVASLRPLLESAFPGVGWERRDALPATAEDALYFLHTGFVPSESVEQFDDWFGRVSPEVARRVILEDGAPVGSWLIVAKHGMAGALSQDLTFIGRADIHRRLIADEPVEGPKNLEGQPLCPEYAWFWDFAGHVVGYVRQLDEALNVVRGKG